MPKIHELAIPAVLAIMVIASTGSTTTADDLKEGTYKGDATTKTTLLYGKEPVEGHGTVRLVVKSIDEEGNVDAEFKGSNGLVGKLILHGTYDQQRGKLRLDGTAVIPGGPPPELATYESHLRATVNGNRIKGKWNLITHYKAATGDIEASETEGVFKADYEAEND